MDSRIMSLTAQIVSAHIGNNEVPTDQLSALIRKVHQALFTVSQSPSESTRAEPAVSVKKSAFADHLVCLECGKHFKTLKRHLTIEHQMTAHDYRSKFGLPDTYPMVAPDYAKFRSAIAKKIGLGSGGHRAAPKKSGTKRG
jgi:predicted transcriptional regulator